MPPRSVKGVPGYPPISDVGGNGSASWVEHSTSGDLAKLYKHLACYPDGASANSVGARTVRQSVLYAVTDFHKYSCRRICAYQ